MNNRHNHHNASQLEGCRKPVGKGLECISQVQLMAHDAFWEESLCEILDKKMNTRYLIRKILRFNYVDFSTKLSSLTYFYVHSRVIKLNVGYLQ